MKFIIRMVILGFVSVIVNIGLNHIGVGQGSQIVMAIAIGFFGGVFFLPKVGNKK